jgi:predicted CXXCH cytochrome family protein
MMTQRTTGGGLRKRVRTSASGAALAAALICAGCSPAPAPKAPDPDRPAATGIGGSSGRYVSSAACRECHAAEYDAWSTSRHRESLRPWRGGDAFRLAANALPKPYRATKEGEVAGPGPDGKETVGHVAFLLGGRHREDALVRLADGRVQVFPFAFDVDGGKAFEPQREMAGGEPPPPGVIEFWTRVGRNADIACYGCHATGQTVVGAGESSSGLVLPASKWVEPGVGCEACHGPGGPHVDAARAGRPKPGAIKMTHADAAATVDACAACHGLRDVLPSPFAGEPAHRYGESIVVAADPLLSMGSNSEFRNPYFADLRPATYQQEAIAFGQSGCARKGGMTCSSCHDVHAGSLSAPARADDHGDAICASCHAAIAASGATHTLHAASSKGSRCLDCHMAPIVRGPGHDPARDHSMAPPAAGKGEVPAACAACHAGAKNADRVADAWKRRTAGAAAKRRLAIVAAIDAASAGSKEAPGLLAHIVGDAESGWFLRWAALQRLSDSRPGPTGDGVLDPVRRALADPNPAIRRAAARVLGALGATKDMEAVQRATDDDDPWTALEAASALGRLGAPTAGARLLQLIKRPDLIADARAQYAYGHACLVGQDAPRAEIALRRALELNPMMVGAINDLGLALVGQDKREPAIAAWKRALDINPRYSAARRNLETAQK